VGWNIELAFIRKPKRKAFALEDAVPEVFAPTKERVIFGEASSMMRGLDLCAAEIQGWIVVVDINCRLSGVTPWLREVSAAGDVYVIRIDTPPIEIHYQKGKKQFAHKGIGPCLKALGRGLPAPDEYVDGESVAFDLIRERTGLKFAQDICDQGKYPTRRWTIFKID
jgi:hypothetical protein